MRGPGREKKGEIFRKMREDEVLRCSVGSRERGEKIARVIKE